MVVFLVGCQDIKESGLEQKLESKGLEHAEVDLDNEEITVKTESGTEIKVEGFKEGEWCPKGAIVTANSDEGDMTVEFVGILDQGEFSGLCHKIMNVQGPSGPMEVNVYVNEDGKGFQVVDYNGQEFKQEYQE